MERDIYINSKLRIPGSELIVTTSRSSGPGGQHVQKTDSKVTLRWNIISSISLTVEQRNLLSANLGNRLTLAGEIVVQVDSERSQRQNREIARERLAGLVLLGIKKEKPRKRTKPSKAAKARRAKEKMKHSEKKQGRSKISNHD